MHSTVSMRDTRWVSALRDALDGIVRDSLRPVSAGVGGLFLLFALFDVLLLPPTIRWPVTFLALATAAVLLGFYFVQRRWTPPLRLAHPLAGAMAVLVLTNILLQLTLRPLPTNTSHLAIYLIGVGCFFLSPVWLAAMTVLTVGGWAIIAGLVAPQPFQEWLAFAYELLAGIALSLLVFNIRLTTYRRFQQLRLEDEQLKTELRQTVDALRQSEHFTQRLADTAPFLMYVFDLAEDRLVYLNSQFAVQLGYPVEELERWGPDVITRLVHPDDRAVIEGMLARLLRAGNGEIIEDAYRARQADGQWRWFRSREVVFSRHPDGSVRRVLGTAHDITDRRRAEEQVRELNAQLVHAARLSVMGEMAAGVAHDLHQPLEVIVNYAQGCVRRLQAERIETAELVERLHEIAAEAMRAGEVIRRIRGFLQQRVLQRRPVDLNAIVMDAMQLARFEQNQHAAQVAFHPAEGLPAVTADPIQITQVVLNLVLNAIQATAEVEDRERRVVIETRPLQDAVEVSVADNGPGVPVELHDQIFDQFVTTKERGLGMGLAISHSIIDAHGGRIGFTTQPGQGGVFRFTLPLTGERRSK